MRRRILVFAGRKRPKVNFSPDSHVCTCVNINCASFVNFRMRKKVNCSSSVYFVQEMFSITLILEAQISLRTLLQMTTELMTSVIFYPEKDKRTIHGQKQ